MRRLLSWGINLFYDRLVSTLQYPFEPVNIPPGIDQDEYRQAFTQAQVYLVGTAHFSKESCDDVKKTVQAMQPDFVMVIF
jgi:hypothetical protein